MCCKEGVFFRLKSIGLKKNEKACLRIGLHQTFLSYMTTIHSNFPNMKKSLKFSSTFLLVCLAFLGFNSLQAQTVSKAKYDKTAKVLSLDETSAFGYLFQLDIAPMGFASKDKADDFFSNWTTELVSFQVNFEKKTANVMLNLRSKSEWKAKEWNTYLAQLPKQ